MILEQNFLERFTLQLISCFINVIKVSNSLLNEMPFTCLSRGSMPILFVLRNVIPANAIYSSPEFFLSDDFGAHLNECLVCKRIRFLEVLAPILEADVILTKKYIRCKRKCQPKLGKSNFLWKFDGNKFLRKSFNLVKTVIPSLILLMFLFVIFLFTLWILEKYPGNWTLLTGLWSLIWPPPPKKKKLFWRKKIFSR